MAIENENARELARVLDQLVQLTGAPYLEIDSMLGFLLRAAALSTRGASGNLNEWRLHYDPNERKFWVSIGDIVHFQSSHSPIDALKDYALSWLGARADGTPRPDLIQAPAPDPRLRCQPALSGPALN